MKRDALVEMLINELGRKKARNPAFSLRSFSKQLGIDASNLSKILNYQKEPGTRLKTKLAKKIGLKEGDLDQILSAPQPNAPKDSDYVSHSLEIFQVVASWHHYAILELFKLTNFNPTPARISKRLGIPVGEAEEALRRLLRVGLVEKIDGRLVSKDDFSSSILTVATSKAHREHQREILEKAIDALENIPIEQRSQSSMTLALDSTKIDEAKRLIKKFRRDLGRCLSSSENLDEVYHLSVSLYPVTIQEVPKERK